MDNCTYEAKIILSNSSGAPITVQVMALTPNQAQKAIEAMYAGKIKSWCFHPYKIKDENGRKVN